MPDTNRQWLIAASPLGRPLQDSDWTFTETAVRDPGEGEVVLKHSHISFDPAQKGWMENIGGYVAPTKIGDVMPGSGLGQVVASNSPRFRAGDWAMGRTGWQEYATVSAKELTPVEDDDLRTANLSVLGTTGMTAFFGLYKIGKPFPGDTLVVTGAAGATGSVVGQIGKLAGCRVVGVAGGEAKCRWLVDELAYDAAIDYKAGDIKDQVKQYCPDGIDVLWDNVGGKIFNTLLAELALHARVVVCGGISRYELGQMPAGPENYFNLIFKRATMSGFIVLDWTDEFPWARERMKRWIRSGQLKFKEDVQQGLENAPRTLMRLFQGENFGKQMLKL